MCLQRSEEFCRAGTNGRTKIYTNISTLIQAMKPELKLKVYAICACLKL